MNKNSIDDPSSASLITPAGKKRNHPTLAIGNSLVGSKEFTSMSGYQVLSDGTPKNQLQILKSIEGTDSDMVPL